MRHSFHGRQLPSMELQDGKVSSTSFPPFLPVFPSFSSSSRPISLLFTATQSREEIPLPEVRNRPRSIHPFQGNHPSHKHKSRWSAQLSLSLPSSRLPTLKLTHAGLPLYDDADAIRLHSLHENKYLNYYKGHTELFVFPIDSLRSFVQLELTLPVPLCFLLLSLSEKSHLPLHVPHRRYLHLCFPR